MTYRERRERRIERLEGWAAKRESAAAATFKSHETYRGDHAFNFQPGHIPQRTRVIAQADRAFESLRKAESMNQRAEGIQKQLDHSIYSDDHDAVERLQERIAGLEAERDRIKQFNASCRKGAPDLSVLDDKQRQDYATMLRVCAYQIRDNGSFPSYATSNLSGNIKRNKDRLAQLQRA